MTKNLFKLNTEKSEAIVFFPAKQRDSLPADVYITVAGHQRDSLPADVYITVAGHQRDSLPADVYITVAGHQRDSLSADVDITVAGHQRDSLPADVYITVAGHGIQLSLGVRNLGVQFDSNLKMLLFVPASLTVTHGDHRFAVCSAVLWNNLTRSMRTAKHYKRSRHF